MGNVVRHLTLEPGQQVNAISVMGACVLDFREPSVGGGVIEVRCIAVMGLIEIVVPRGVRVDMVSGGFLGSFEQRGSFAKGAIDKPLIRVMGTSIMGSVLVREPDDAAMATRTI